MKTDFYTKTVLTVIAICLTFIVLKQVNLIPDANANTPTTNFKNNMNYGLIPIKADGSIDVNIKSNSSTMDVNIVDISTSDELDVNIDEIGGGYVSYGGPISVKVE